MKTSQTWRASRWVALATLAFSLAIPADALAAAGASGQARVAVTTAGDQTATHALLEADYALEKAIVAHAQATETAVVRASKALGEECKGALRGAPKESLLEPEGLSAPRPKLSGRKQGERARSELEKQTIDTEIDETIVAPANRILRAPDDAFISMVDRLAWSNPTIDALVHESATRIQEELAGPPVAACAEIKAWAASGFHVLPRGSRRLKEALEARAAHAVDGSLKELLRPYEDSADRLIAQHTAALGEHLREKERATEAISRAQYRMEIALGEKLSSFTQQMLAPVIAKGQTHAGTTFVVRASVGNHADGSCGRQVYVEVREGHSSSSGDICLNERARSRLSGSCSGSSVETIELVTAPDVRTARVRLSNGRTITASVVRIPAKDGGPAGLLIDAFRGYNPYPVSLQELSSTGKVLLTVGLKEVRCTKEPGGGGPQSLQSVDLATFTSPYGEALNIGVTTWRFQGQTEFSLESPPGIRSSKAEEGKSKQFQWNLSTECAPHPYTVLDGILVPPGASVLARTATGLTPLTKVEPPASIHAQGPIFYGIYTTPPTEIIIQRTDGTILYTESLAAKATEETEFCEGYAEP